MARSIEGTLQYYEEYDALRVIVGHPAFSAVHPMFFEVINRIDSSITFMRAHVYIITICFTNSLPTFLLDKLPWIFRKGKVACSIRDHSSLTSP